MIGAMPPVVAQDPAIHHLLQTMQRHAPILYGHKDTLQCIVHLHEGIDVILRNITSNRPQCVRALELLLTSASELLVALVLVPSPDCNVTATAMSNLQGIQLCRACGCHGTAWCALLGPNRHLPDLVRQFDADGDKRSSACLLGNPHVQLTVNSAYAIACCSTMKKGRRQ
jgi:hypothetical protein